MNTSIRNRKMRGEDSFSGSVSDAMWLLSIVGANVTQYATDGWQLKNLEKSGPSSSLSGGLSSKCDGYSGLNGRLSAR
jgi:hypothetical protein